MTGVMEFCLVVGIMSVIVETHPKLVQLLVSTGWEVTELGLPSLLDGGLIVPIHAKPSISGLMKHHQLYSLQGSTLLLEPEAQNPLNPEVTLRHLPNLDHGKIRPIDKSKQRA
jgi:acyl-homoserine lactone synthase